MAHEFGFTSQEVEDMYIDEIFNLIECLNRYNREQKMNMEREMRSRKWRR